MLKKHWFKRDGETIVFRNVDFSGEEESRDSENYFEINLDMSDLKLFGSISFYPRSKTYFLYVYEIGGFSYKRESLPYSDTISEMKIASEIIFGLIQNRHIEHQSNQPVRGNQKMIQSHESKALKA